MRQPVIFLRMEVCICLLIIGLDKASVGARMVTGANCRCSSMNLTENVYNLSCIYDDVLHQN